MKEEKKKVWGVPMTKDSPTAFQNLTPERRREVCSAGGKASQEVQKFKRTMKALMGDILKNRAPSRAKQGLKELLSEEDYKSLTNSAAICWKQIQKAIEDGDTKAATFCRDTSGENPTQNIDVSQNTKVVYVDSELKKDTNSHIDAVLSEEDE